MLCPHQNTVSTKLLVTLETIFNFINFVNSAPLWCSLMRKWQNIKTVRTNTAWRNTEIGYLFYCTVPGSPAYVIHNDKLCAHSIAPAPPKTSVKERVNFQPFVFKWSVGHEKYKTQVVPLVLVSESLAKPVMVEKGQEQTRFYLFKTKYDFQTMMFVESVLEMSTPVMGIKGPQCCLCCHMLISYMAVSWAMSIVSYLVVLFESC